MSDFWMTTVTNERFDLGDPDPSRVHLADISHGLALTNRYGGHTPQPYTVAEHAYHCYREAIRRGYGRYLALRCLHHDDHEAYTGDHVSPVKKLLGQPVRDLENKVQAAIEQALLLPPLSESEEAIIREIDLAVGAAECRTFRIQITPGREQQPADLVPRCWPWYEAQRLYRQAHDEASTCARPYALATTPAPDAGSAEGDGRG